MLPSLLYKHYGRKVIILIDEYEYEAFEKDDVGTITDYLNQQLLDSHSRTGCGTGVSS